MKQGWGTMHDAEWDNGVGGGLCPVFVCAAYAGDEALCENVRSNKIYILHVLHWTGLGTRRENVGDATRRRIEVLGWRKRENYEADYGGEIAKERGKFPHQCNHTIGIYLSPSLASSPPHILPHLSATPNRHDINFLLIIIIVISLPDRRLCFLSGQPLTWKSQDKWNKSIGPQDMTRHSYR